MDELIRLRILVEANVGPAIVIGTADNPIVQLQSGRVPDQAVLGPILQFWRSGITGITFAEWQALDNDLSGLRTYQGVASPTLAQTVAATKAQNRVLAAILRDKR